MHNAHTKTRDLLDKYKTTLVALASQLLQKETLDKKAIDDILGEIKGAEVAKVA